MVGVALNLPSQMTTAGSLHWLAFNIKSGHFDISISCPAHARLVIQTGSSGNISPNNVPENAFRTKLILIINVNIYLPVMV